MCLIHIERLTSNLGLGAGSIGCCMTIVVNKIRKQINKDLWQILRNTEYSEISIPLTRTSATNSYHSHFLCQLFISLTGLQSLFGQVLNTLPLGQRRKVNIVHLLIGRRS